MEFAIDKLEDLGLRPLAEMVLEQDEKIIDLEDEIERLNNIIDKAVEYIEDNSQMTDLRIYGIKNVLSFRGSVEKLLEILDKEM